MFLSDLVRSDDLRGHARLHGRLELRPEHTIVRTGTAPQGPRHGLEGRAVVIVEDIVDTGLTLTYLQEILRARGPAQPQDRMPAEQAVATADRGGG